MDLMGQLGDLLQQYSGAQGNAAPAEVDRHFEQVSQAAPASSMAEGLLAAFMDSQHTPSFGNQAAQLFGASGGEQKSQMMNMLLAVAGPMIMQKMAGGQGGGGMESALAGLMGGGGGSALSGLLGGGGGGSALAGMLGGGGGMAGLLGLLGGGGGASMVEGLLNGSQQVTPEMANQIPQDVVEKLAHEAAQHDPSIMERLSSVYAEHPTLIKTLGGAALTIAMSRMAENARRA